MTTWTDMGNVSNFGVTPTPTLIKHKNTRGPLKRVDLVAVTLFELGFTAKLDEFTIDNVLMALLGTDTGNTAGAIITAGVHVAERQLRFTGENQFGPQWEIVMPDVLFSCKDTIEFLGSDDFATLPLSGDILFSDSIGGFATLQVIGGGSEVISAPSKLNYYLGTGKLETAPLGT